MSYDLSDYVDVAERIGVFHEKWPNGTLTAEAVRMDDGWLVTARAFRTPDDPCPGVGHAFQTVPGTTPYTKGSELENAETSAWGRAIVACGIPAKKIATKEDVQRAQAAPAAPKPTPAPEPAPKPAAEAKPEPPSQFQAPAGAATRTRPDMAVPVEGKPNRYAVTSHITYVTLNDRGWYEIGCIIDGTEEKLATKLKKLAEQAGALVDTTARVEFTEKVNGKYVNRYLEQVETVSMDAAYEAIGAAAAAAGPVDPNADIPFAWVP